MKKLITIFLLFAFIFLSAKIVARAIEIENVELRKKIGQMVIVGFNGTKLSIDNPLWADLVNERISGVIIFSKDKSSGGVKNIENPAQLKSLIAEIQAASPSKLFISVDEEGGNISRLSFELGFGAKTLSHKDMGRINDKMITYVEAKKIAEKLHQAGINMNFAPCVDLALNKNSEVIYKRGRAFSNDPKVVTEQAKAYISAHKKYNIITVIKHFPGHGSSSGDTHNGFVDATKTYSPVELQPYIYLADTADGVMVSHIYNKTFDEKYPASLSENTVNLLQKQIGYRGLIVTDDIQMKAISDNFSFDEAVVAAVNAGADIVIIGNNLKYDPSAAKNFNDAIFNAVKSGKIKKDRIDRAYEKIMKAKERV